MKASGPEIDTAQTPRRFDGRLALLEKSERLSLMVSRTSQYNSGKGGFHSKGT